ncbi:MAG: asparagine synthase (glutamine-hydrolyzing) [Bacteroidetes bacterium]|nr:MAG: asparagine synthase (glutamine-hydrolyzing) [Bacteroidota bacterium]
MCGITGFCDFNRKVTEQELRSATDSMLHRGPDDSGTGIYETDHVRIGLGQRRLSIMDISPLGHQPMVDPSGKYAVILNGEIYNFKEIRKPLEDLGYKFKSESDTEVVLVAIKHYGLKIISQFIGMYVIVFWDHENEKLYIIRDRAGVKPLYYYHSGNCLLFASELKAFFHYSNFEKNVNPSAVQLFFKYAYIPAPHTIFEKTYKLPPAHTMEIDCKSQSIKLHKYWDVYHYYNQEKLDISEEESLREIEKLLISSFNYRMVSDVPVGLFLSGGYDSSCVAAILQATNKEKIKTFTIGFKEKAFDEAVYAKKVANHLQTDHHEYYCTHKEAIDIIPQLPFIFDEPFGDPSSIPTVLVSRFARQSVTVALSADAGDEVFGGYNRYGYLQKIRKTNRYIPSFLRGTASSALNKIDVRKIPGLTTKTGIHHKYRMLADVIHTEDIYEQNLILSSHYRDKQLERLLLSPEAYPENKTSFSSLDDLSSHNDYMSKILALDYKTYLPDDILVKVDRATMSVSLEGREPFLDQRIIEFVARLPIEYKIRNGEKKYLLKKITHKYLPREIMERPKMGFGVPIGAWLQKELRPLLEEYVEPNSIRQNELLNADFITKSKAKFLANPDEKEGLKIWLLLMFQMWWKKWM